MTAETKMLTITEHGGVAVLCMHHGKASAMDTEFLRGLAKGLEEVKKGPTRALVITGTGRIFSAGVDLRRVLEGRTYLESFLAALDQFLWGLMEFPKPVVAAVNGHAIAGGCVLTCAADRRIASDKGATIGAPELVVGVPFPPSALEIMRATVPTAFIREVLLQGTVYDSPGALARGLVDELVSSDDVLDRALECAQEMARIPETSFRLTKAQWWAPYVERARRDFGTTMLDAWSSTEVQGAISAYVEKTLGARKG